VPIPVIDYAHVRITVTDIARSRRFYDDVFGFQVLAEAPPEDADQATKDALWWVFGGIVYRFAGGVFGVRPVAPEGDRFDEDRVGLDHVSFAVPSVEALETSAARLDELGIAHGGVKDIGSGSIVEFRDPDGIALELFAPAA